MSTEIWKSVTDLPPGAVAVLAGAAILCALILNWRVWRWLLGPVFVYEMGRLSRQRKTVILRCTYIVALLAVLYSTFPPGDYLKQSDLDGFASRFSQTYIVVQAGVILLLTPLYVSGAISEEKEKGSLDFLLVTRLTSREIVLGKLAARLVTLFGILLAGLPVLALTQLWGGVDIVRVLAGVAATALSALSTGSIAILCSVLCRKSVSAIVLTYGLAIWAQLTCYCLPLRYLSSPIALEYFLAKLAPDSTSPQTFVNEALACLAWYAVFHIAAGVFGIVVAASWLRLGARPPEPYVPAPIMAPPPPESTLRVSELAMNEPCLPLPPIGPDPLLWKERFLGQSVAGLALYHLAWIIFIVIVVLFGALTLAAPDARSELRIERMFLAFAVAAGVALLCGFGLRLAQSVSREREQQTLASLLTLPVERGRILEAKWFGGLLRGSHALAAVVTVLVTGMVCGAFHPLSAAWLALALGVHILFVGNLALCLSVFCRSTLRANLFLVLFLLFLFVGIWLLHPYPYLSRREGVAVGSLDLLLENVNPWCTWSRLAFGWDNWGTFKKCLPACFVSLLSYLFLAVLLWRAAQWGIRRKMG